MDKKGSMLRVLATGYGRVHEVSSANLRPGWCCDEAGVWTYKLGGTARTATEWESILAKMPTGRAKGQSGARAAAIQQQGAGASSSLQPPPASESGPPGFKWGVAVEVMSGDDSLKGERERRLWAMCVMCTCVMCVMRVRRACAGCWCPGEVLRTVDDDTKILVAWLAETDPPNATADVDRARPSPPAPPAGWAANLKAGEAVDVYHDGALFRAGATARLSHCPQTLRTLH